MKFCEINQRYTDLVANYIATGYHFNTATMSGSQGEIARVDLTNGTEIITIYIESFSDWSGVNDLKGVQICIAHVSQQDELIPDCHEGYRTLWLSHAEVEYRERYYQVGRDANWYVTEEEAKAAAAKQYERYTRKPRHYGCKTTKITNPKAIELAKQYLIDNNVGKRIDLRYLEVKKTFDHGYTRWYIVYKSKYYSLH